MNKEMVIMGLHRKVLTLWQRMCKADNISKHEKFIIFSDDNPVKAEYDQAVSKYNAAKWAYKAGVTI